MALSTPGHDVFPDVGKNEPIEKNAREKIDEKKKRKKQLVVRKARATKKHVIPVFLGNLQLPAVTKFVFFCFTSV